VRLYLLKEKITFSGGRIEEFSGKPDNSVTPVL
jgi:hypothetical protein